jgi:hypothetical protein
MRIPSVSRLPGCWRCLALEVLHLHRSNRKSRGSGSRKSRSSVRETRVACGVSRSVVRWSYSINGRKLVPQVSRNRTGGRLTFRVWLTAPSHGAGFGGSVFPCTCWRTRTPTLANRICFTACFIEFSPN